MVRLWVGRLMPTFRRPARGSVFSAFPLTTADMIAAGHIGVLATPCIVPAAQAARLYGSERTTEALLKITSWGGGPGFGSTSKGRNPMPPVRYRGARDCPPQSLPGTPSRPSRGFVPAGEAEANPGVPTLGAAVAAVEAAPVLDSRRGGWRGSRDARKASRLAREMVDRLGGPSLPLSAVTSEALEAVGESLLREGFSGASINRRMAAISKVLRFHARRGVPISLPVIPRYRESEPRKRVLSDAEVRAILERLEAAGHRTAALFGRFAYYTAARFGEIARLRWRDIDLVNRVVVFPAEITKANTTKAVPLAPPLAAALPPPGDPDALVFEGFAYRTALLHLRDAARAAGVRLDPGDGWHTFRRTTATALLRGGLDVARVQKMLGHRQISTTLRYTQIVVEDLRPAEKILGDV